MMIPIKEIFVDDEFNCRGKILPIHVIDLLKDIEQNGLLQPVLVTPWAQGEYKYKLIAGFRRMFAHRILKRDEIDAVVRENLSAIDALRINLSENLQRQNLNILQEALAIEKMHKAGLSEEETAKAVNMSRGWVQVRFMLLTMPDAIKESAAAGLFNLNQIRELYKIRDPKIQLEAAKTIKEARERGEKKPRVKAKVKDLDQKKERKRHEIFDLLDFLMEVGGSNIGTRTMAWCAGEISTRELLEDYKHHYASVGKMFIPESYHRID